MAQVQGLNQPTFNNIVARFTLSASGVAINAPLTATLLLTQQAITTGSGVSSVTVDSQEVWHIVDSYVDAALTTDLVFDIVVGGNQPQNINARTAVMSASSNTSRINPFYFGGRGLTLAPNKNFQVNAITTAAYTGTVAVDEDVNLVVYREPLAIALARKGAAPQGSTVSS